MSVVQIYVVAPYAFVKMFATLQNDAKSMLYAKGGGSNMTKTAALKLHQFLSGQQEADKLLANLIAFTRQPVMGAVPTAARNTGIFYLLPDASASRGTAEAGQSMFCKGGCVRCVFFFGRWL